MYIKDCPNKEELLRTFNYDPLTGKLYWNIKSSNNKRNIGDSAGCITAGGYWCVRFNKVLYQAHRLIYVMHYGYLDPSYEIDHIDGNTVNNRIENLRKVLHSVNCQNRKLNKNNTSGRIGVTFAKKANKWRAFISIDKEFVLLGYFPTKEEATQCRELAEKNNYYHPNHGQNRDSDNILPDEYYTQLIEETNKLKVEREKSKSIRYVSNYKKNPWSVQITVNRKGYFIGNFPTKEAATLARDEARIRLGYVGQNAGYQKAKDKLDKVNKNETKS